MNFSKSSLRDQLAQQAAAYGFCKEPKTVTYACLLFECPQNDQGIYDGSDCPTEPLIAEEGEAAIEQKAQVRHRLYTPGSYLVILEHKVSPFSAFGSEPAKFLPRKPRIYTCTKCFGFHHVDKCRYNPVTNCGIRGNTN